MFQITPAGLRWWFSLKYGKTRYSEMVRDVRNRIDENKRNGGFLIPALAEELKQPLLVVQKIIHAEHLL